jgi:RNA-splicing ligase RtcB
MGIAKSKREDFTKRDWDSIGKALKSTKGGLGDIGSGNHFLDALESYSDNNLYFVCHTGSRFEGKELQNLIDSPKQFDEQYRNTRNWARENRLTVMKILEKYFGRIDIILDKDHNHYEVKDETIIIRKGAVQLSEGELTIIPSSMTGDMVLVKGSPKINEINNSLSHGTGRCFSRSQGKAYAEEFDFGGLRRMIYIPDFISDASIKTEAPFCYRDLDDCLSFISEYIEVQERYSPFAYLGQL